jgi:hypothetical protein
MDRKQALTSAAIAALTAAPASVLAQMRDRRESNENLRDVQRRVDALIDELSRDAHDYGGHRVNAINALQRARNEIIAAERFRRY